MSNLLRDVRFGARMFGKNPWFTCTAVTVLALGIGANTAIFSLVNAFLLKPLVIRNPAELVGCYSRDTGKASYRGFSYPDYAELRKNDSAFSSLLAHNLAMVGLSAGDTTRRVFADIVSANYFTTFGVPLFQGRPFTAAEERPASAMPPQFPASPGAIRIGRKSAPIHSCWARACASTAGFIRSSVLLRKASLE